MQIFKHIKKEEAQGLVEYALLLVLVAVIVIAILAILGSTVTLVFARVMGGFNGDTLDNDGAVYMTGASTATGSGLCSGNLTNINFVAVDNDGNLIKNSSVSRRLFVNGSPGSLVTGTANANGVATAAGPIIVSGTCPLKFTMGTN